MKIEGDGFLSDSGLNIARQIVARNNRAFLALERTISEVHSFVSLQEVREQDTEEERQKIIALILATRVLEISEAALLIMKSGMSNEANTLFRVFLDAYFVIGNVFNDASFVSNYFKSDEAARLKLLNAAKKHNSELFKSINEYASKAIQDALQKRITEEQIQAFNSYAYADNIGCSEIYDTIYRVTSGSIHTTPRSLEKYIEGCGDGNIALIKYHPLEGDIPQRVYDFSYFLIKILRGLKELFGCLDEVEIQELVSELDKSAKNET